MYLISYMVFTRAASDRFSHRGLSRRLWWRMAIQLDNETFATLFCLFLLRQSEFHLWNSPVSLVSRLYSSQSGCFPSQCGTILSSGRLDKTAFRRINGHVGRSLHFKAKFWTMATALGTPVGDTYLHKTRILFLKVQIREDQLCFH